MSKALLICNGEKPGLWLKPLARQADFILAADGGAGAALAAGVRPDAVIGDLDSISPAARRALADTPFIAIKRQDNTDLEKALDWLTAQSFDECIIVGAAGGRLDFTLGNILSLRPYLKKIKVCLRGENWSLFPLRTGRTFSARPGARLSLLALEPCRGVTLRGVKYPLTQAALGKAPAGLTLSNEVTAQTVHLSFTSGYLLVYLEV